MPEDNPKRPAPAKPGGQMLFDWESNSATPNDETASQPAEDTDVGGQADPVEQSSVVPEEITGPTPKDTDEPRYEAGHPWHYLPEGDNAPPLPFEDIEPNEEASRSIESDLPKAPARRVAKVRQMLDDERKGLQETRIRYKDVVARGAEALSRYDCEIAYGGNEQLARAGTLALLVNQISWRLGRIAYLERQPIRTTSRHR